MVTRDIERSMLDTEELYLNSPNARRLQEGEAVNLHEFTPLLSANETLRLLGLNGEVLAGIRAGGKDFLLLDLKETPELRNGKRVLPGRDIAFNADYLLIDSSFTGLDDEGFKGVSISEPPITIGRSHFQDRFAYPGTTSRNHFRVEADREGRLLIRDLYPANPTYIFCGGSEDTTNELTPTSDKSDFVKTFDIVEHTEFNNELPALDVGAAERPLRGEDRSFIRNEDGLFAVFDGAGGHYNGSLAAETARQTMAESRIDKVVLTTPENLNVAENDLKAVLQEASVNVAERAGGGITTAVAARIINVHEQGQDVPYVVWASAGDSRIYVYSMGTVLQLSRDEGFENRLTNCLGSRGQAGKPCTVRQTGNYRLISGDKIILVSDGITGDREPDLLSNEDIAWVCTADSQTAAQSLIQISRKRDDKTAIVIGV